MTEEIAKRIKEARIKADMSQRELGELLGYEGANAQRTVTRWEHNERPVPLDKIRLLAKVLDLTLDDLIP